MARSPVTLSDEELGRLSRIASADIKPDLTSIRLCFAMAVSLLVIAGFALAANREWYFAMASFSAVAAMMGFMRLGYHKLFRIIQYQSDLLAAAGHRSDHSFDR